MLKRSLAPRGAFTLVEMLVVIGVISLIAAISLPVFSRVRGAGYKTVCSSNMKQLGIAFQQYSQDTGGRYPLAGSLQTWADGGHWITGGEDVAGVPTPKDYNGTSEFGLADPSTFAYVDGHHAYPNNSKSAIYPYVKSVTVFQCPAAAEVVKKGLSYSMNCALAGAAITRVRNAGELILLMDEGDTINDGYFWATKDPGSTDALFKGHNGDGNILFVDGHVKPYNFNSFPLDSSAQGLKNKWTGTGAIRFHDRALGPNGSNALPGAVKDVCFADLKTPRDWTKEP